MPKYGNLDPDPQKSNTFKNSAFTRSILLSHFQLALKQYQSTLFSQIMPETVILVQNAQICNLALDFL